MHLKQLRALLTVAETGNVTRAAEILHIVQPAVSRQIRLLEEDVGTTLFDRGRHGMELTAAGKTLVEYARRALDEIERARAEIRPSQGAIGGIVTIGLLPSTCDLLSSPLVAAVAAQYPGIRVRISMSYAGHLQQWLESGEVDAALLYNPRADQSLHTEALVDENLWVVGLPSSGLSQDRPITLQELAEHPLVLPGATHGLRSLVEHAAALMSLKLNVVAETNAMSVQKCLVLGGHGLTVLPTIAVVDDLAQGRLAAAPIAEPELKRRIVLALPTHRQTTAPVRCVVTELVRCIKNAVLRGAWGNARWMGE